MERPYRIIPEDTRPEPGENEIEKSHPSWTSAGAIRIYTSSGPWNDINRSRGKTNKALRNGLRSGWLMLVFLLLERGRDWRFINGVSFNRRRLMVFCPGYPAIGDGG